MLHWRTFVLWSARHGLPDARDEGPLILTHLYLLLGCAIPLWLSGAGVQDVSLGSTARGTNQAGLAAFAGIVSLGVGDAAVRVVTHTRTPTHPPTHAHTYIHTHTRCAGGLARRQQIWSGGSCHYV